MPEGLVPPRTMTTTALVAAEPPHVVSSLVVALPHFSPATLLPPLLLLLGAIFGVLFAKTNDPLACTLLHALPISASS